ncbi:MAG: alpha/beta fold hydrolase [Halobacteriota archaeon]
MERSCQHIYACRQVPYLKKKGYKVISMDLRGFGRSQYYNKPDKPAEYTYERWAKDLGVILQWYDLQHVTLVGYSLGGAVAMRYMSGPHPRVENLVLVSAAGPNMHEEVPPPNDMRLAATRMGLGMFADMIGDFDGSDATFHKFIHLMLPAVKGFDLRDGTNEVEWIKNMFESASHPALIGGLNEMREKDITQGVRTISTPTRICYGLFDPFVLFAWANICTA